jgi:hypothetical protein
VLYCTGMVSYSWWGPIYTIAMSSVLTKSLSSYVHT